MFGSDVPVKKNDANLLLLNEKLKLKMKCCSVI